MIQLNSTQLIRPTYLRQTTHTSTHALTNLTLIHVHDTGTELLLLDLGHTVELLDEGVALGSTQGVDGVLEGVHGVDFASAEASLGSGPRREGLANVTTSHVPISSTVRRAAAARAAAPIHRRTFRGAGYR